MIGRLRGLVAEVDGEEALIDVQGVGYLVRCGARTLARLPGGQEAVVHVETQVSQEGGARLYGFLSRQERAVFRLLQTIQGVGPKAALAVLDLASPAELAQAVAREDRALLSRASGVGPKLALRIVTELKGKPLGAGPLEAGSAAPARPGPPEASAAGDAVSALMGLGIAEAAARRAVDRALGEAPQPQGLPSLIKAALQEVGR